jgi:hypothetical protein
MGGLTMKHTIELLNELETGSFDSDRLKLSHESDFDLVALLKVLPKSGITALDLCAYDITDTEVISLACLSSLRELRLSGDSEINKRGARILANSNLISLDLSANNLSQKSIQALTLSSHLTELNLSQNRLDDMGVTALAKAITIKTLYLNSCELSDALVQLLAKNNKLLVLYLSKNKIQNDSIQDLLAMPALTHLDLSFNQLNDLAIEHLAKDTKLSYLNISYNQLTKSKLSLFKANTTLLALQVFHSDMDSTVAQELANHVEKNIQATELRRNEFIITVMMLALAQNRDNKPQLFKLPLEMLIHIFSYLSFPSIKLKQHHRSGEACASFIFKHRAAVEEKLNVKDWPGIHRLCEEEHTHYEQSGHFKFYIG